jgi:hypothetical protein
MTEAVMTIPTEFESTPSVSISHASELLLRHYEGGDEGAPPKAEICALELIEVPDARRYEYGIRNYTRMVPLTYAYPILIAAFLLEEMHLALEKGCEDFDLMVALRQARRFYASERHAEKLRLQQADGFGHCDLRAG